MQKASAIPAAPPRPIDGHKGTFGTVIVVGGSETMIGAPALCASAALRAGAGLVKIATSVGVLPFTLVIEPSATGIALASGAVRAVSQLQQADPEERAVLAVGPGIGKSRAASALVMKLLRGKRIIVLDADGLNLLAATGKPRPSGEPDLVMTPHPGEFARLAKPLGITAQPKGDAARAAAAAELARRHRAVVVLKGHRTVISDGQRKHINTTGNPALATAGSGDVLTGLIAGLIAQHMPPFDAAVLGVYLHGLAADLWASRFGPSGLTARDLTGLLPETMNRHRKAPRRGIR